MEAATSAYAVFQHCPYKKSQGFVHRWQETVKRSIKEAARRQKQWVDTSLLDETVMKMSKM